MEELRRGRPSKDGGMAVIMEELYENKEYLKLYSGLIAANEMVKEQYYQLYVKLLSYISEIDGSDSKVLTTKIRRLYDLLVFVENPNQNTLSSLLNNISYNLTSHSIKGLLGKDVKESEILNDYSNLYEQIDYTQAILDGMNSQIVGIGDTYHFQLLRRDPEIRKIEFLANTLSYVEYPRDSEVVSNLLRSIGSVPLEAVKVYKK